MAHADHVDRLARDTGLDQVSKIQAHLVEAAVHLQDVTEFGRLCTGLRHALRPEALDERDAAAYDNRRVSAAATMDGVVVIGGCGDAEGGAYFDRYVQQILGADEEAPGDPPDTSRRHDSDGADDTAGETRATYHTGAGLRMGLAAYSARSMRT